MSFCSCTSTKAEPFLLQFFALVLLELLVLRYFAVHVYRFVNDIRTGRTRRRRTRSSLLNRRSHRFSPCYSRRALNASTSVSALLFGLPEERLDDFACPHLQRHELTTLVHRPPVKKRMRYHQSAQAQERRLVADVLTDLSRENRTQSKSYVTACSVQSRSLNKLLFLHDVGYQRRGPGLLCCVAQTKDHKPRRYPRID